MSPQISIPALEAKSIVGKCHICISSSLVVNLQHSQFELPVLLRVSLRELHVSDDTLQQKVRSKTNVTQIDCKTLQYHTVFSIQFENLGARMNARVYHILNATCRFKHALGMHKHSILWKYAQLLRCYLQP